MKRNPVYYADNKTLFLPAPDRGWYLRYSVTMKRCPGPDEQRLINDFCCEERDDGRLLGHTWAFRRVGGHLDGGLYRRYFPVVEQLACSCCGANLGELCWDEKRIHRLWGSVCYSRKMKRPSRLGLVLDVYLSWKDSNLEPRPEWVKEEPNAELARSIEFRQRRRGLKILSSS